MANYHKCSMYLFYNSFTPKIHIPRLTAHAQHKPISQWASRKNHSCEQICSTVEHTSDLRELGASIHLNLNLNMMLHYLNNIDLHDNTSL